MSEERGLYGKYVVTKTGDGTAVENCFVLKIDDDPHARMALAAYARSVEKDNPALFTDLRKWLAEYNMPVEALVEVSRVEANELVALRDTVQEIRQAVLHARDQHNIWQDDINTPADDVAFLLTDLASRLSTTTDELRGLREIYGEITLTVQQTRRQYNIQAEEISGLGEDVSSLLTDMSNKIGRVTDDAAALRVALEGIRDMARRAENTNPESDEYSDQLHIRDLLGSVAYRAVEGLKEHQSGVPLSVEFRQIQALVDAFEKGVQETGGWRFSGDRTLAQQVQRCVDHYTRMAAGAVSEAHEFKDDTVSWLRGIAINAQSVSWASTHAEKDARLRGLIEVIETAITKINEKRVTDRLSSWNGVTDSWMKSDFPTREMRRRILDQEEEIKRLRKKAGEDDPRGSRVETPVEDVF